MKKIIILTLIAVLTFGCKTTKSVITAHLKTDLITHADSISSVNSHQIAAIDSTVEYLSILTDNSTEVITQTNFARPDSTGKQAIVSTIVTERTHGQNLQKDVKTTVNTAITTDKKETVKTDTNVKVKTDLKETTKTKTSWNVPWWVYLIAVGLVIILVFALRRMPYVSTVINWIKNIFNK